MTKDEFLNRERSFWLKGESFYEDNLDPDAIMVFPDPVGVMSGRAIMQSLKDVPRWDEVDLKLAEHREADGIAVVTYRASAVRGDDPPYAALCGSVYRLQDDGWQLSYHQQTPAA